MLFFMGIRGPKMPRLFAHETAVVSRWGLLNFLGGVACTWLRYVLP